MKLGRLRSVLRGSLATRYRHNSYDNSMRSNVVYYMKRANNKIIVYNIV